MLSDEEKGMMEKAVQRHDCKNCSPGSVFLTRSETNSSETDTGIESNDGFGCVATIIFSMGTIVRDKGINDCSSLRQKLVCIETNLITYSMPQHKDGKTKRSKASCKKQT
jgi:hypothetical protein